MAEKLTKEQELAVTNRGGNLLVSAAAGSGKTKVLVDRLMSYISDPVAPESIDRFLIITYTKAAAAELRSKIAAKLSERIAENPENRHLRRQMQRLYLTKISTVHSFCGDILREYAYMQDYSGDFRVADEKECVELQAAALERILDAAYQSASPDSNFFAFVDTQGLGRDDRLIPQLVLSVYRKAKCHLDYEGWLDDCLNSCNTDGVLDACETKWGSYLIDDLHWYIERQVQALNACIEAVSKEDHGEKVAALLSDTVAQLQRLCNTRNWDEIISGKDISYGTLRFPTKFGNPELQEQIKQVRENCKKGLAKRFRRFSNPSERLLSDIRETRQAIAGLVELVRSFDLEYSKMKQSRHILDFSDLEHKTLDLLWGKSRSGITSVAKDIGARFREIMVDEYQDSNAVQDSIFRALTTHRNNCFMVGDVKQSIYQFRMADPEIFLDKYSKYQPAETVQDSAGRKVLLSKNFRSGAEVIEAVNDVFYDCMTPRIGGLHYTQDEALSEGVNRKELSEQAIELYGICANGNVYSDEATFVANRISQLLDGTHYVRDGETERPIRPEDIVILMRSPGSVGMHYKRAIEQLGINCEFGKGLDLFETEEVQFLHAFLQVISNPLQDIPLIAVLASRVFGFTADDLAYIRTLNGESDFYTALRAGQDPKITDFLKTLDKLRYDARMLPLPQLVDRIIWLTEADAIFQALSDGQMRMDNIRSFCAIASSYASAGTNALEAFLDYLQVIAQEGVSESKGATTPGAVSIMTIHKSKGLEFPVVFLCGLAKEFNMEHTQAQVLCDSLLGLGLSCVDKKVRARYPSLAKLAISAKMQAESVSEEMRVLYVAMTRPKDRLIMTYTSSRLEKELTQMANLMDFCDPILLCSDVMSAGEWVLMSALRHSEATAFHKISAKPSKVRMLRYPWKIALVDQVEQAVPATHMDSDDSSYDEGLYDLLKDGLSYRYPYQAATQTPSKMTATQLKGRYKDQEITEGTKQNYAHRYRKPTFIQDDLTGTRLGSVLHTVMQYLHFENCQDLASVQEEIRRIATEGHLSEEQANCVDAEMIYRFFATEPGKMLRAGTTCVREFKFSILEDAARYLPQAEGEQVLLQGVVDCAIISDSGITIIDFKSDHVPDGQLEMSVAGYRAQVNAYAGALEKIFNLPIQNVYLYYFVCGQLVCV